MRHNTPDNPNHREDISENEALSPENASWDKVDQLMEAFRKTASKQSTGFGTECPMTETVLSYALDEADPEKRDEIRSHLMTCPACWDLYFDARTAIATAGETGDAPMEMPPAVAAAMTDEKKTAFSPRPIYDFFQNIISFLNVHRAIAAPAICSVLIFAAAAIYYSDVNAPINARFTMIAQPPPTRSGDQPEPKHVGPGDAVFTGDRYRIRIEADEDGHGYIIIAGSSGRIAPIYAGPVREDDPVWVPGKNKWAQLDQWAGEEILYLIVSKKPIKGFEEKVEELAEGGIDNIGEVFAGAQVTTLRFSHER